MKTESVMVVSFVTLLIPLFCVLGGIAGVYNE